MHTNPFQTISQVITMDLILEYGNYGQLLPPILPLPNLSHRRLYQQHSIRGSTLSRTCDDSTILTRLVSRGYVWTYCCPTRGIVLGLSEVGMVGMKGVVG